MKHLYFALPILFILIPTIDNSDSSDAVYLWPLSSSTGAAEVKEGIIQDNQQSGLVFNEAHPSIMTSQALTLDGVTNQFVDLNIGSLNFNGFQNFSVGFGFKAIGFDGCLFHYQCSGTNGTSIIDFKAFLFENDLNVYKTLGHDGHVESYHWKNVVMSTEPWYFISIGVISSSGNFAVYIDNLELIDDTVFEANQYLEVPGTLRLGSSLDGSELPLTGGSFCCLTIADCILDTPRHIAIQMECGDPSSWGFIPPGMISSSLPPTTTPTSTVPTTTTSATTTTLPPTTKTTTVPTTITTTTTATLPPTTTTTTVPTTTTSATTTTLPPTTTTTTVPTTITTTTTATLPPTSTTTTTTVPTTTTTTTTTTVPTTTTTTTTTTVPTTTTTTTTTTLPPTTTTTSTIPPSTTNVQTNSHLPQTNDFFGTFGESLVDEWIPDPVLVPAVYTSDVYSLLECATSCISSQVCLSFALQEVGNSGFTCFEYSSIVPSANLAYNLNSKYFEIKK